MSAEIPEDNPIKAQLRSLEHLTAYATTYRYPTPGGRVIRPKADLGAVLRCVDMVLADVAGRFGVDLQADTPARSAKPFR
jgi:hypothetical protein